jgi:hypothetical protein
MVKMKKLSVLVLFLIVSTCISSCYANRFIGVQDKDAPNPKLYGNINFDAYNIKCGFLWDAKVRFYDVEHTFIVETSFKALNIRSDKSINIPKGAAYMDISGGIWGSKKGSSSTYSFDNRKAEPATFIVGGYSGSDAKVVYTFESIYPDCYEKSLNP